MVKIDWSISISDLFTLLIGLGTILLACVAIRHSKAQLALGLLGEQPSLTWESEKQGPVTKVHFTIHNGYKDYLYVARLAVLPVLVSRKRVYLYRDIQEKENGGGLFLSGIVSARVKGRSVKPCSEMNFSISVVATSPSKYQEAILVDLTLRSQELPWVKNRIKELFFVQVSDLRTLGLKYQRDRYFMTILFPAAELPEQAPTHNPAAQADGCATA